MQSNLYQYDSSSSTTTIQGILLLFCNKKNTDDGIGVRSTTTGSTIHFSTAAAAGVVSGQMTGVEYF